MNLRSSGGRNWLLETQSHNLLFSLFFFLPMITSGKTKLLAKLVAKKNKETGNSNLVFLLHSNYA
jgi:hypothetical protein